MNQLHYRATEGDGGKAGTKPESRNLMMVVFLNYVEYIPQHL